MTSVSCAGSAVEKPAWSQPAVQPSSVMPGHLLPGHLLSGHLMPGHPLHRPQPLLPDHGLAGIAGQTDKGLWECSVSSSSVPAACLSTVDNSSPVMSHTPTGTSGWRVQNPHIYSTESSHVSCLEPSSYQTDTQGNVSASSRSPQIISSVPSTTWPVRLDEVLNTHTAPVWPALSVSAGNPPCPEPVSSSPPPQFLSAFQAVHWHSGGLHGSPPSLADTAWKGPPEAQRSSVFEDSGDGGGMEDLGFVDIMTVDHSTE
ncbi:hypothetical protein ACOMHN_027235 [Nucella lapillus]